MLTCAILITFYCFVSRIFGCFWFSLFTAAASSIKVKIHNDSDDSDVDADSDLASPFPIRSPVSGNADTHI